jgi:hypothetical protein
MASEVDLFFAALRRAVQSDSRCALLASSLWLDTVLVLSLPSMAILHVGTSAFDFLTHVCPVFRLRSSSLPWETPIGSSTRRRAQHHRSSSAARTPVVCSLSYLVIGPNRSRLLHHGIIRDSDEVGAWSTDSADRCPLTEARCYRQQGGLFCSASHMRHSNSLRCFVPSPRLSSLLL